MILIFSSHMLIFEAFHPHAPDISFNDHHTSHFHAYDMSYLHDLLLIGLFLSSTTDHVVVPSEFEYWVTRLNGWKKVATSTNNRLAIHI